MTARTFASRGFLAGTLIVITLLSSLAAYGWEADVHYGLTFWLAIKAGFSQEQANWIAWGDVEWDEGLFGPATRDSVYVIAVGSEQASKTIRLRRFPTDGPVPGPPEDRPVKPKAPRAQQLVRDVIDRPIRNSK